MLKKIKEKIIHKLGGMTEDECRQYVTCLEYNDIKSIKAEKDGKVVWECSEFNGELKLLLCHTPKSLNDKRKTTITIDMECDSYYGR